MEDVCLERDEGFGRNDVVVVPIVVIAPVVVIVSIFVREEADGRQAGGRAREGRGQIRRADEGVSSVGWFGSVRLGSFLFRLSLGGGGGDREGRNSLPVAGILSTVVEGVVVG